MIRSAAALFAVLLAAMPASAAETGPPPGSCHSGAYALADGSQMVVSPSVPPDLRYRLRDGRTGRLYPVGEGRYESGEGWAVRTPAVLRVDFGQCRGDGVRVMRDGAPALRGSRIALPTIPVRFRSGDTPLYGELVLPGDATPRAAVVMQYGGGRDSAVYNNFIQHLLPLEGIAVFVYDKPGTGRSGGRFNAHVGMLADDLVAAVEAVRERDELQGVPLGLMGESQGGWVAPLAASRTPVDFVVVSYGLAVSMLEEDRLEVAQSLRMRGYGPDVLARGEELHRAAARVLVSRFDDGLEALERLKAKYRDAPWFDLLQSADLTGPLTATPAAEMPQLRTAFDFPYDLRYDPLPVLAALQVPQLWLLARKDTEAPHASSLTRLQALQVGGSPIDVIVFPNADHGIIQVRYGPEGRQLAGRHGQAYFDRLIDWILRQPPGAGRVAEN